MAGLVLDLSLQPKILDLDIRNLKFCCQ